MSRADMEMLALSIVTGVAGSRRADYIKNKCRE